MKCMNDIDMKIYNVMCFLVTGYNKFLILLKCCHLIQQRLLAAECRVFWDYSAAEFHKLRRRIWQNLPRKNGVPANYC